uniref:Uncharacterized protein n=1 Tax=Glossina pallidipes TaxID=7398 RepID=A0A1A9ZXP2_GLOPL
MTATIPTTATVTRNSNVRDGKTPYAKPERHITLGRGRDVEGARIATGVEPVKTIVPTPLAVKRQRPTLASEKPSMARDTPAVIRLEFSDEYREPYKNLAKSGNVIICIS